MDLELLQGGCDKEEQVGVVKSLGWDGTLSMVDREGVGGDWVRTGLVEEAFAKEGMR